MNFSLNNLTKPERDGLQALHRLVALAKQDTGGSARAANFLLAWWNAAANGGFDPTDLWGLDADYAADVLAVMAMIKRDNRYPEYYGYKSEFEKLVYLWRTA